MKLFLQKNAKFSSAEGSAPRPPCLRRPGTLPSNAQPPAAGGSTPRPTKAAHPLRISGYAPGHSLLLSLYLHRISRKENSARSVWEHPLQDLNQLLLDCPASEHLFVNLSLAPFSLFSTYSPDLWVWPDCWVSAEFLRTPSLGKGRVVPSPPPPPTSLEYEHTQKSYEWS